jgi:hypothetical protein
MCKQGMQRAASCKILFSKSESFRGSLSGMMQRQPSSDNLCDSGGNGRNGGSEFTRPQLRRRDQPSSSRSLRSLWTGSMDQEVEKSPPNSPRRSHKRNTLGSSKSEEEEDQSKSPLMKSPKSPQRRLQMSPRQQSHSNLLRCGEKTPTRHHYRPKIMTLHDGKMSTDDKFSAEDQPAKYLAKSPHRTRRSMSMKREQSSPNGLIFEKQSEDPQSLKKSSSFRRLGLLRQLSQDIRLPYEKSEELSKARGRKRDEDLVKPSESLVAGGSPNTPPQRSSSTRQELSKARSFKSLFLSSEAKPSSSLAVGRSNMPRQ